MCLILCILRYSAMFQDTEDLDCAGWLSNSASAITWVSNSPSLGLSRLICKM